RHGCASFTRFAHDNDSASAVSYPVFHKIGQNVTDLVRIEPHLRELAADLDVKAFLRITRGHPARDQPTHRFGKIHHLTAHLQPPGLDTGDVEQIVNETGHSVGAGVHRLQHDQRLFVGEAYPRGDQGRWRTFAGHRRRTPPGGDLRAQVRATAPY